jgi:hypothetical protein
VRVIHRICAPARRDVLFSMMGEERDGNDRKEATGLVKVID